MYRSARAEITFFSAPRSQTDWEFHMGKLFSINEAAAEAFGRPVSPFSVRRWISRGVGRPVVKLKAR